MILLLIAFAGFGALAGKGHSITTDNNFADAFVGTRGDISGVGNSLYSAIWAYVGYSNLFYAVGEINNPRRVIRMAGPLAILSITVIYMLVQIAYFAAVSKDDISGGSVIVASIFFQNMFGEKSARALSVFVGISAVANVFAVVFSQGRLNQALGRDGIAPFSKFLASNWPARAPLAGVGWHVICTLILVVAPPKGDVSRSRESDNF